MTPAITLFVAVFAVLMFLAPLGVWNRLIKMHRDAEKRAKEQAERQEKTNKLLTLIANELSRRV